MSWIIEQRKMAFRPSWKIARAVAIGHFALYCGLIAYCWEDTPHAPSVYTAYQYQPQPYTPPPVIMTPTRIAEGAVGILTMPGSYLLRLAEVVSNSLTGKYMQGRPIALLVIFVTIGNSLLWGVVFAYLFALAREKNSSPSSGMSE
jgi:hypothetical protein